MMSLAKEHEKKTKLGIEFNERNGNNSEDYRMIW